MLGSAKGRDFTPFFDDRLPVGRANESSGVGPALGKARLPRQDRQRYAAGVVTGFLDGVSGLGWSVIGFIGGAVFWHFVGFWGFVSDVVLSGGETPASVQTLPQSAQTEPRESAAPTAATASHGCTLLFRDRRTGHTVARACDGSQSALAQDLRSGREDRLEPAVKAHGNQLANGQSYP